ncbi:MAG: LptF/LptG family permease [Bacteroidia bacterium]|nr:LptF/LptG family permease [Bacteroidia bacterium]
MKIIDSYVIKRFIYAFLFMLFAVVVITVVVDLVEKIDYFLEKKPPLSEVIFDYYLKLILYYGNMFAPICVFLSVIFFTSQMAQRSELVAILGAGISFYRLLRPYLFVGVGLSVLSFILTGYIVPKATAERIEFEYKYTPKRKISRDRDIHKRVMVDKKAGSEVYVYMTYFDNKRNEAFGFTMSKFTHGKLSEKLTAQKAIWQDSISKWELRDVVIRKITGNTENLQKIIKTDTAFNLSPGDIFIVEQKSETMNTPELVEFIKNEEIRGSEILNDLYIQRYRRFSDPVALIILTIIGYAISSRKSRGGTALQIGLGVVISIVYIALLLAGILFVGDSFPAWIAVWIPNILFFPISLLLLRLAPK